MHISKKALPNASLTPFPDLPLPSCPFGSLSPSFPIEEEEEEEGIELGLRTFVTNVRSVGRLEGGKSTFVVTFVDFGCEHTAFVGECYERKKIGRVFHRKRRLWVRIYPLRMYMKKPKDIQKTMKQILSEVHERDKVCKQCGSTSKLEVDHIKPISRGGKDWDVDNLQLLCKACHVKKSSNEQTEISNIKRRQRKLLIETIEAMDIMGGEL